MTTSDEVRGGGSSLAEGGTVAVTGADGLIGRRLVARLLDDPAVPKVIALDVSPPETWLLPDAPQLQRRRADVRDPAIVTALAGADVVVHLAAQVDPVRDEAAMRTVNVDGARNVAQAAASLGARKLVHVSSASVYGAHPDNPLPLREDAPLRPNAFSYAEHKAEVERWLEPWAQAHPDLLVTVLRPAIVAGPGVTNFITRQLDAPRFPSVRGHRPPMQFVHVDDVASALHHVVRTDLPGVFNVSAVGWLSFDEVTAISGRRPLEVPEELAFGFADLLWRLGLGQAPAGQVPYVMHPWVVSVEALLATGWHPQRSNRDAFAELAAEHADQLVLGRLHTRRSTVRVGLATTFTAAGLGLVGRAVRRRSRRASRGAGRRRAAR